MRSPLVLAALVVMLTACGGTGGDPSVAASVDGAVITVSELQERFDAIASTDRYEAETAQADPVQLEQQVLAQLLTQMIQQRLLTVAAADRGIEVTDADVAERLDELIAAEIGGREAYEALLVEQGLTQADVDAQVRALLLQELLAESLGADVTVDEAAVQAAYEQQFSTPTVRHILVATEEEARQVLDRLAAGEDFTDLAAEVSQDPGSGAQGGELGPLVQGRFVAPFEEAALAAEPGEVVGPVQTEFGWHVIEVLAPPPLEDVRADLEASLRQQQAQGDAQALTQEIAIAAEVEVNPRFGRWDASTGQVLPSDPLGETRPAAPDAEGAPAPQPSPAATE